MPNARALTLRRLGTVLEDIERAIYTPIAELHATARVTAEPVPYAERLALAERPIALGEQWGKRWDCAWFHLTGTVPAEAAGQRVALLIDVSGEACVFDARGTPVQGLTTVCSSFEFSLGMPGKRVVPLLDCAAGGEPIDLWLDAGNNDLFGYFQNNGVLKEAHVALCCEPMRQLYYDFFVLLELYTLLPEQRARAASILHALTAAARELCAYTAEEAGRARRILAPELAKAPGTPSLSFSALGHAHIDLAWLWPLRETIRKGARSFATVLALMERYPEYVFGASQPQLYAWMKERYPGLYERIRQRIAEGRWEPQGAMWVEADTNVSGGEALVRQVLYGKRFFRQEFGHDPKMLWLPDVFGYSAALPQILNKAGIDYFLTIKLSWNEVNLFPYHTFFWQGIDGSRVLAHMPPEGTYNSSAAPRALLAAEETFREKGISEHAMLLFGIGDGGGGPGEEHLERLHREAHLDGVPPVMQEPAERFFARIAAEEDERKRFATWVGELYLEKHQGTYTTQARNKRFNRKLELALRDAELASVQAGLIAGHPYPGAALGAIWKEMLLYQFHDILPGSSITRVYEESLARYQALLEQTEALTVQAERALAEHIATEGMGAPVLVSNSLSWERQQWLRIGDDWRLLSVPALGYAVVDAATATDGLSHEAQALRAETRLLENDVLRVAFAADGSISAIYDKVHSREVLVPDASGNALTVYDDPGDAWDFPPDYAQRHAERCQLTASSAALDGPRAVLRQEYTIGQSRIHQQIVLTLGSPRLDFFTEVDWRESHRMLRTRFPVAILATTATCDIQFGSIERPTHSNTSWDRAKYEVCAHKWVDLAQPDYGVALLNDCKYGHSVAGGILDLNLLRSPTFPDERADQAIHTFAYALYPHAGDCRAGGVVHAGYEFNVPLRTRPLPPHTGTLPSRHTFLTVDAPNVIVEAVKQAEDGGDIILRLYEAHGATTPRARLRFGWDIAHVIRTNLLEEEDGDAPPLAPDDGAIELRVQPFEIVTLKVSPASPR